jgi:hypothetical protein
MMTKIVALWDALHVPLIHRSRFYLAFRGREIFYFEAECRRLTWLQSEIGSPEDPNPLVAQKAKRLLARNMRKLDVRPPLSKPVTTAYRFKYVAA